MFDWQGLLKNYKFWIAVIGVITSGYLFYKQTITAEQFATALTGLAVIVIGFVTYENNKAVKSIRGALPPKK